METITAAPTLVMFDVYETLLDMTEVERRVNHLLDSKRGYMLWFEMFMEYCFVNNSIAPYQNFNAIGIATMQMASQILARKVDERDIAHVMDMFRRLPIREGAQQCLSALHDQHYRIAALTNSSLVTVMDRMERTGLISYFEAVLSAEATLKYKPAPEVYKWACSTLKVQPAEVIMVSAHGWDIAGAANAGMMTAYLTLENQVLYPLAPTPHITCNSLAELANSLANMPKARLNLL